MNKTRLVVAVLSLSAAGLVGIAGHEAYRGTAYRDSTGIPTIGYGETSGVKMGQKTTPDRALVQLLKSANAHGEAIKKCITVPLYQHEYDAYTSLAYNIGSNRFCQSGLVKKLNAGNYSEACADILKYKYAGGKISNGLIKRRQAEYWQCRGQS